MIFLLSSNLIFNPVELPPEDIDWIKSSIFNEVKSLDIQPVINPNVPCKGCSNASSKDVKYDVSVAASFSMPDELWLDIDLQLIKQNGVFVLQGLPQNSFKVAAQKIYSLRKKGLKSPVQIDPKKFDEHGIKSVPAYFIDGDSNKNVVFGSITPSFAIQKLTKETMQ